MTTITRTTTKMIGKEIEEELKALAARHGLEISYAGGSYSPSNATIKLSVCTLDANGEALTAERQVFDELAEFYGLKKSDYGATFTSAGTQYRIVGLRPRAQKYPILVERTDDGRRCAFDAASIRRALGGLGAAIEYATERYERNR